MKPYSLSDIRPGMWVLIDHPMFKDPSVTIVPMRVDKVNKRIKVLTNNGIQDFFLVHPENVACAFYTLSEAEEAAARVKEVLNADKVEISRQEAALKAVKKRSYERQRAAARGVRLPDLLER